MNGCKEDGQAGCTGNPYWGAAKKACGGASVQRPDSARGGAYGGASGSDDTHDTLTGGLKGGDGHSQGGRSDGGGDRSDGDDFDGRRSSHDEYRGGSGLDLG
jgi:hypothetical protein